MLSRLVINFLPGSKHLLISWLQSPSTVISEPKKIKSLTVSTVSPSICHEVMGHGTTDRFQIGKVPNSEKVCLKLNIQKTKIMASDPITSCQIDGGKMETVTDFIFGAPKSLKMVTGAMKLKDACSLEEKL